MDINQIQELLDKYRELPIIEREKTLFDIGTRGHFENPTTDVLAFFSNGLEQHGMGNLVADSFVDLLNEKMTAILLYSQTPVFPEREVSTKDDKRIDLLLSLDSYLLVIEAKVGHDQVNPFHEYEKHADRLAEEQGKQAIYIMLSPQGKIDKFCSHPRWIGISFAELACKIKLRLTQHFMEYPFDKWSLILKDFILHMENLMVTSRTNKTQSQFALENINEISGIWKLLIDSLALVHQEVIDKLSSHESLLLKYHRNTWFQPLPAYRYYFEGSRCQVIFFSAPTSIDNNKAGDNVANIDKYAFIQVHVEHVPGSSLYEVISEKLGDKIVNSWSDKNVGYLRWPVENLKVDSIVAEVIETLELVNSIESTV